MPGHGKKKSMNICLQNHEVVNYQKYIEKFVRYNWKKLVGKWYNPMDEIHKMIAIQNHFTIKDRFYILNDVKTIFEDDVDYDASSIFIIGEYACYRIVSNKLNSFERAFHGVASESDDLQTSTWITKQYFENITRLFITLTPVDKLPWTEFFLTKAIKTSNGTPPTNGYTFRSSSFSYRISKLSKL